MSTWWFEHIPRSVTGSMLVVGLLFALVFGALYGGWGALAGGLASWLLHWTFWVLRYAYARYVWGGAGDHYGLSFGRAGAAEAEGPMWPRRAVSAVFPSQVPFELVGELDGRPARIFVEGKADEKTTTWRIDCSKFLPDHLHVEHAPVAARSSRWVDIEDVAVGHSRLDDRARIGGRDTDSVREFFWEHDLADVVDELYDDVSPFDIRDGRIEYTVDGVVRLPRPLVRKLEKLRTVADRLELAVTGAPETARERDDTDATEESDERDHTEQQTAHVYD